MLARLGIQRREVAAPLDLPNHPQARSLEHAAVEADLSSLNRVGLTFWFIPVPEPGNVRIGIPS